jgi:predicted nucleic acid-binding protein
VLAAAIGGDADLIVSGDDDLLALGHYQSIDILSARDVLILIENSKI